MVGHGAGRSRRSYLQREPAPVDLDTVSPQAERLLGRILAVRHPILLAWILLLTYLGGGSGDWSLLSNAAHALFGSAGLHVFADNPTLQAGPPSLVVVRGLDLTGRHVIGLVQVLLAIDGWLLLWLAERAGVKVAGLSSATDDTRLCATTLLLGLLVLEVWSQLSGGFLHVDDALALTATALAVRFVLEDRWLPAALAAGSAGAFKPWAIVAIVLVAGLDGHRVRSLLVAVAVPVLCWAPFLIGVPGTLHAASPPLPVSKFAIVHLFGVSGLTPSWLRAAELAVALALAAACAARGNWLGAAAVGITARLLLDPLTLDYYTAGAVMALAGWEIATRQTPWRTVSVWAGLWVAPKVVPLTMIGPLRLVTVGLVVVVTCLAGSRPVNIGRFPLVSSVSA
jgi:hypothetical protein